MWPVRKAENLPSFCAVVTKYGNLNFLDPSGPLRACNGTAFSFFGMKGHGFVTTCDKSGMRFNFIPKSYHIIYVQPLLFTPSGNHYADATVAVEFLWSCLTLNFEVLLRFETSVTINQLTCPVRPRKLETCNILLSC